MISTMATAAQNPQLAPLLFSNRIVPVNSAPADFDAARDLPKGFLDFLAPLHAALTMRQRALIARAILRWRKRARAKFPITCRHRWRRQIRGTSNFWHGARTNAIR